jgi:hypothetical protein
MAEDRRWTLEEANAALGRVGALVDRARAAAQGSSASVKGNGSHSPQATVAEVVAELAAEGIVLRDVEQGLIDFPARSAGGRDYWLCWVVGEAEVGWWHWPEDGFAGRTPVSEPPD